MKAANTAVFSSLDKYCSDRGVDLANAGAPRWITTTRSDRQFLIEASLIADLSLSASLKAGRFDYSGHAYFVTSGFDVQEPPGLLQEEDSNGGILTAFLAELLPAPVALPSQVKDIVESADMSSDPEYEGHDHFSISSLYPNIQVFSAEDLLEEESPRMFFLLCVADKRRSDQWIDERLASVLNEVATMDTTSVPYETLCRSVLDLDPSALFLALYRCLEALYAHSLSRELANALGITKSWSEMAQTLEATLVSCPINRFI
jgi:hypothetical protein